MNKVTHKSSFLQEICVRLFASNKNLCYASKAYNSHVWKKPKIQHQFLNRHEIAFSKHDEQTRDPTYMETSFKKHQMEVSVLDHGHKSHHSKWWQIWWDILCLLPYFLLRFDLHMYFFEHKKKVDSQRIIHFSVDTWTMELREQKNDARHSEWLLMNMKRNQKIYKEK